MGKIRVLIRDLEAVNFDKLCRLALELDVVRQAPLEAIEMVSHGPYGPDDFDVEGDEIDREYWKRGGRSMTELYAIRMGLGTADASGVVCVDSPVLGPGLVSLCQSLAENHGKVPGVKGGSLYRRGTIPNIAKNLSLLPEYAPEIALKIIKAVAAALEDKHPIMALIAAAGAEWDEIDDALSDAERAVADSARMIARALHEGAYAQGGTFPLAQAPAAEERLPSPVGIAVSTRNPNLMKHLWAALKAMEPLFRVAAAVVSHPETRRVAVLCSQRHDVDVRPVAEALALTFGDVFVVNAERNSIVCDPRDAQEVPTAAEIRESVSRHLAFRQEPKPAQAPALRMSIGSIVGQRPQKRR